MKNKQGSEPDKEVVSDQEGFYGSDNSTYPVNARHKAGQNPVVKRKPVSFLKYCLLHHILRGNAVSQPIQTT